MRIHSESLIRHSIEKVYTTYRDLLPNLAEYIPDVREIRNVKTEREGQILKLHNEWIADREIPKVMQIVVKPEMLRWDDFAEWDDDKLLVNWKLRLHVFAEAVTCGGTNTFVARGADTLLTLNGNLDIDIGQIRGVPRLLGPTLKPQIEKFIVGLITPNLEQVNRSLGRYLDDRA